MASLTDIRRALAAALEQCGAVTVAPAPSEYAPGHGLHQLRFDVRILVGDPADEHALERLDGMIAPDGDGSVKALLEADRTLGGLIGDLAVTRCSGYQLHPRADTDVLGATWTVETLT